MARCGCSSGTTCNCAVKAGANVTVTGVGSAGNPYVVSSTAGNTTVAPLDTATIDTTVTGGPAYVVSSSVIISPDAGNTLVAHGNGLYVADIDTVFTNGNGIAPIVGGVIAACLSTDAGNTIAFGTDGCLFVPPATVALTAGHAIDAAALALNKVQVCLSTDAGNTVVFGTDDCLFVPAATPCISTDANNEIVLGTDGCLYAPKVALSVLDTPTLDLTLTGVGTVASPWVLSGIAKPCISTDVGNEITLGTDGCLFAAADVATTVTALDTVTVNTTVTGGPAYVVSSDVIISPDVGNKLVVHPNGLYVAMCVSTDVGNAATLGTDGCVFVAPAAVSCAAVQACFTTLDTTTVNLSPSAIFPLTADVIIDPAANNLISTTTTNGLIATLTTGCGLSGAGNLASPLIVDTNAAVWPYACAETNGAPVYCDPVTGGLHVDPQQDRRVLEAELSSTVGSVEVNTIGVPIGGPVTQFGPTLSGTFTNPNPCRPMVVIINGGVKHFNMRADTSGRLQFQYGAQLTLTGPAAGVYSPNGSHVQFMADGNRTVTDPNWDFIWDTVATTQFAQFILPAGASFNYTLAALGQLTNYNGDGQVRDLQVFAHFDGQTL